MAFPNVGFIRISTYIFCFVGTLRKRYKICKTKNCAAVSLCRGLRGALWAPPSPLHNDIWVLTIVKTFIIILINEGAQRAPYSSAGAKNEIADDGHFLQKKLLPFILQKNSFCSSIVLEHIYTWRNIYTSHPHHIHPLTGTRAIEL